MRDGKSVFITSEEALTEIVELMKDHTMRKVLSDKEALKETIHRMQAVLDFYKDLKQKPVSSRKKKGVTA